MFKSLAKNEITKCPLCGNDFIAPFDEECSLCHSGLRKFESLPLGWIYKSEWENFEKNIAPFRKWTFGILPKLIAFYGLVYKRLKRIDMSFGEETLPRVHIVLWGPSSSGKTWFLYAFLKKMTDWKRVSHSGSFFNFRLNDLDNSSDMDVVNGPPQEGTTEITEKRYVFKKTNNMKSLLGEVNTHVHELLAVDDQGDSQVPPYVDKAERGETKRTNYKSRAASLREASQANALFLLVDLSMSANDDVFNRFIESIRQILETLYTDGILSQKRYLAVCVPKIDQLEGVRYAGIERGDKKRNFEIIVEEKFKNQANILFERINEFIELNYEVEYFFVSSCGYLNGRANYDPVKKRIANLKEWQPEGVYEPFFWAFEAIERARILNIENHRVFQALVRREMSDVSKIREALYISYHQIDQMSHDSSSH